MKTLRIKTVALLLGIEDLEKVREWCRSNNVSLYEKGVIEFVLLDEVKRALGDGINVKLKIEKL
jgi:hypothetical protein